MSMHRVPVSTYRLQFNAGFAFADAAAIVDYLEALGISHCYASNYFQSVPGSAHGYDVSDPTRLHGELGTEADYRHWVATLRAHGMGHIVDLVPNHMGIAHSANPWWQDVLENGPSSRYARVFDIDWHPLKPELENKVLLPILGGSYGTVLENQEIRLEYHAGAFVARYFDTVLPIAPGSYQRILEHDAYALLAEIGASSDDGIEFLSILSAISHLPPRDALDAAQTAERDREKEVIKRRLAALTARSATVLAHVERALSAFNGRRGDAASFDALDALLSAQAYRLAYWRVAAEEINYRRFFDINELAAIRMEDPDVFALSHAYAFELLAQGQIDGFRIDHVDGLFDPREYLARLRRETGPIYLVVEKILGVGEALPDWPVDGTTGYEFMVTVNNLFVDARNATAIDAIYDRFARMKVPFRELAYRGKQLVLRMSMASELSVLASGLNRFSERNRHYRDFTLASLVYALREIIASFPVYRTYVTDREEPSPRDCGYIEEAVREAKRRNPRRPGVVFDFVRDLLLKKADYIPAGERDSHMKFVGQFQQVTSPVTAKGIEDTALYIFNRLVSLNDVGSEPDRFGASPGELHDWLAARAERWPHGLSASSTHDTKRSEDVRARINVLSELPGAWKQALSRWARMNRRGRSVIDGEAYPSRNEEYFLYQALVGTWPPGDMDAAGREQYAARIDSYMLKAMREAKVFTSWLNPSQAHEAAMTRFVRAVLSEDNTAFRADFLAFQRDVARWGLYNSLSQLAIKIAAPGVPDFYQGSEVWDLSLVDPDNRRPVDYGRLRSLLRDVDARAADSATLIGDLLAQPDDPRLKLFVTAMLLRARRARRELFEQGAYARLEVDGARREHVFAFLRHRARQQVILAVPRLLASLDPTAAQPPLGERTWGDTRLLLPPMVEAGHFRHLLTGQCLAVAHEGGRPSLGAAAVFEQFPIGLLEAL